MFTTFLLLSCKSRGLIIDESLPSYDQKVEKFVATRVYKGEINMIVEGRSAIVDARNIVDLSHPVIKLYDKGDCVFNLIAENVKINMETCDVKCSGKCVINAINGENLQTTNLMYNAKNNLIYSNNDVKFTKRGETIYGTSFKSDTKLNNIVIKNHRVIID
jgi:LPS export ABC transporter protein LptC